MFLLIGAAFGVALAATILIGQYVGANNLPEAKRVVGTSATFFAAISVAMAVTGLALCRPLLIAMHTPADSLPLAVAYMRVIFSRCPVCICMPSWGRCCAAPATRRRRSTSCCCRSGSTLR